MNKLLLFDIDGTLTHTTGIDDKCFIQALQEVFEINHPSNDWALYTHVTDTGLAREIYFKEKGEFPTEDQLEDLRNKFIELIHGAHERDANRFREVPGALDFLKHLNEKNIPFAYATGGWGETALQKLSWSGLPITIPMSHAGQHHERKEILRIAQAQAQLKYKTPFEKVIYFGDGIWDMKAADELGFYFIGVDVERNRKLKDLGCEFVIPDFTELHLLMTTVNGF